jgi:hypothetical protein
LNDQPAGACGTIVCTPIPAVCLIDVAGRSLQPDRRPNA